jgi:hypothetical protein
MNCIETKNNIESLIDGELEGSLKQSIESHLLVCRKCCELREDTILLSSILHTNEIATPSEELDERVMNTFRLRKTATTAVPIPFWRKIFFGSVAIPKPLFAAILLIATAISWTAFQVGKSDSTIVEVASPVVFKNEVPVQIPSGPTIKTVVVEVPAVKEKIVTKTVYVRVPKSENPTKDESSADAKPNFLLTSSSVADNGYITDVSLKGFELPTEISAKIIKEEKKDEK